MHGRLSYAAAQPVQLKESAMERKATAVWSGGLKDGKGSITTDSGALSETPYSFSMRFENQNGTNPEELIAAAHAGCFTMALSAELGKAGITSEHLQTTATVTLKSDSGGFSIPQVKLSLKGKVPGSSKEGFIQAANTAKTNCPVSKLLRAEISLDIQVE